MAVCKGSKRVLDGMAFDKTPYMFQFDPAPVLGESMVRIASQPISDSVDDFSGLTLRKDPASVFVDLQAVGRAILSCI
jgi:hypothetical protein